MGQTIPQLSPLLRMTPRLTHRHFFEAPSVVTYFYLGFFQFSRVPSRWELSLGNFETPWSLLRDGKGFEGVFRISSNIVFFFRC